MTARLRVLQADMRKKLKISVPQERTFADIKSLRIAIAAQLDALVKCRKHKWPSVDYWANGTIRSKLSFHVALDLVNEGIVRVGVPPKKQGSAAVLPEEHQSAAAMKTSINSTNEPTDRSESSSISSLNRSASGLAAATSAVVLGLLKTSPTSSTDRVEFSFQVEDLSIFVTVTVVRSEVNGVQPFRDHGAGVDVLRERSKNRMYSHEMKSS